MQSLIQCRYDLILLLFQANDRKNALEETMKYMTQSLASVAYQINVLAGDFLTLLDAQESNVCELSQEAEGLSVRVMVHKERVARRQIGQLTTNKASLQVPGMRQPGIIYPDHVEKLTKYVRQPIDYHVLDNLGHGGHSGGGGSSASTYSASVRCVVQTVGMVYVSCRCQCGVHTRQS